MVREAGRQILKGGRDEHRGGCAPAEQSSVDVEQDESGHVFPRWRPGARWLVGFAHRSGQHRAFPCTQGWPACRVMWVMWASCLTRARWDTLASTTL